MTRIGIIGSGWGSRVQAPIFREVGFDVVEIRGREWQRFADENVDVVSVVVPPAHHLEIAQAALAAGKHVICEKPTALNVAQAEELAKSARAHSNQIAIIDHELRFLPSFRVAREQIRDVRYIEVRYSSPARGDRSREWSWFNDASEGGGVWGAVGSHFVDAIRYLVGEIEAVEAASFETIIKERSGRAVTSDDVAAIHLRLTNGAIAMLSLSAVAAGQDEAATITIHGEIGAWRLTGEDLLFAKPKEKYTRIAGGDLAARPGNSPGGAFGTGTFHLAQAWLRGELKPAATFEDGLAQQRVLDDARSLSRRA